MKELESKINALKLAKAEKVRMIEEEITRLKDKVTQASQKRGQAYKAGNLEEYRKYSASLKRAEEDLSFMNDALERVNTEPFITAEETAQLKAEIMNTLKKENTATKEKIFKQIREILKEKDNYAEKESTARALMVDLLTDIGKDAEAMKMPDPEFHAMQTARINDSALQIFSRLADMLPETEPAKNIF